MVASPELKCSRHAEDSSYASPSQDGGEPVAPSCGVILKGPLDGESVFVDSDGAMPANAPSRAEGGAGEDGVQVAGACCPSATTWTHISAPKKGPFVCLLPSRGCMWLVSSGLLHVQSHWCWSLEMLCIGEDGSWQ
jgi:hypothetical protein